MSRAFEDAWRLLKADPRQQLYTQSVSHHPPKHYGDSQHAGLTQQRLGTVHPAIQGLLERVEDLQERQIQQGEAPQWTDISNEARFARFGNKDLHREVRSLFGEETNLHGRPKYRVPTNRGRRGDNQLDDLERATRLGEFRLEGPYDQSRMRILDTTRGRTPGDLTSVLNEFAQEDEDNLQHPTDSYTHHFPASDRHAYPEQDPWYEAEGTNPY